MGETKEDRMVVGRVAHGKQEIRERGRGGEGGREEGRRRRRQRGREGKNGEELVNA